MSFAGPIFSVIVSTSSALDSCGGRFIPSHSTVYSSSHKQCENDIFMTSKVYGDNRHSVVFKARSKKACYFINKTSHHSTHHAVFSCQTFGQWNFFYLDFLVLLISIHVFIVFHVIRGRTILHLVMNENKLFSNRKAHQGGSFCNCLSNDRTICTILHWTYFYGI